MAAESVSTNGMVREGRKARFFVVFGFIGLLMAFAGIAFGLQYFQLRKIQAYRPYVDSLILPRAEYAKTLAFGYDMFMADFLYLRSIQAFGGQWRQGLKDIKSVYHYFYTVTELDPHFMEAYEFGSLVIGEEGKDPELGIELNKKGWLNNPEKYAPAYWNAYTAYYTMKDPERAKYWIRLATKAADCPEFVRRFEYFFERESGNFEAALEKWTWEYLNALDRGDDLTQGIARNQIRSITHDWNLKILYRAIEKHQKDHPGQMVKDLQALLDGGYLTSYTACAYFPLNSYLDSLRDTIGKKVDLLSSITAQFIRTQSGIPVPPFDQVGGAPDTYFIRRDARQAEDYKISLESESLIFCRHDMREFLMMKSLPYVRAGIQRFYEENKRYPNPLEEAFAASGGLKAYDMLTNTWNYDPTTGKVSSPTFPDL